jgi:hypothetical protein
MMVIRIGPGVADRDETTGRFLTGNSGGGRPKGSRNILAEEFLKDVLVEWESHGAVAVSDMREKNPGDFVKMVASLLPKDINFNVNNENEMTDDELRERIRNLASSLAPFLDGTGTTDGGVEAQAIAGQPSRLH